VACALYVRRVADRDQAGRGVVSEVRAFILESGFIRVVPWIVCHEGVVVRWFYSPHHPACVVDWHPGGIQACALVAN
jgi:hypothetical protein